MSTRRTKARRKGHHRGGGGQVPHQEGPLTISVPEAGRRFFGLGKNASYKAAECGEIPTLQVGGVKRVPVRAMERLLDSANSTLEAAK